MTNSEKWKELWINIPVTLYNYEYSDDADALQSWLDEVENIGDKILDESKFYKSEYENSRKHHEECLAFIALNDLLPKYYDWVRDKFFKEAFGGKS